jgi:alpha/beta superfamily hydrolase
MKTKRITFPNARGELLSARLELPEDEQPLAYALFAHCFTCSKDLTAAVHIARALSRRRIAVLRFDFTGLGESEGDFSSTTFSTEVADLVAAASFLEREYQPPQLLIGHSLGGAAVLVAASRIPSARAVATVAAPFHPVHLRGLLGEAAGWIEESGEARVTIGGRELVLKKSLLDDLSAQEPADAVRRLKAALLVMHVRAIKSLVLKTLPRFTGRHRIPRASFPSTRLTTCFPRSVIPTMSANSSPPGQVVIWLLRKQRQLPRPGRKLSTTG